MFVTIAVSPSDEQQEEAAITDTLAVHIINGSSGTILMLVHSFWGGNVITNTSRLRFCEILKSITCDQCDATGGGPHGGRERLESVGMRCCRCSIGANQTEGYSKTFAF